MYRYLSLIVLSAGLLATSCGFSQSKKYPDPPTAKPGTVYSIQLKDAEWKAKLTEDQYYILRTQGTERPFTGKYDHFYKKGTYICEFCFGR